MPPARMRARRVNPCGDLRSVEKAVEGYRSPRRSRLSFRVEASGGVGLEDAPNFITHPPKHRHFFVVAAGGVGGIVEAPMMPVHLPRKDGTRLIGIAANRDHRLDGLG